MDILYIMNHVIFSLFITLFLVEVGMAFTPLIFYDTYKKIKKYLIPMWEINGTFAIFYIVSFEAIYPKLLVSVGTLYLLPIMIAALLFILRNAFISYSEYVNNKQSQKYYFKIYSISTIIIGFLVISIFTSALSGSGINATTNTINILQLLINPFNILIFISLLLLGFYTTLITLGISKMRKSTITAIVLFIIISSIAISTYTEYLLNNIINNMAFVYLIIMLLLIIVVNTILYLKKISISQKTTIPTIFAIILIISISQYPYIYGNQLNINNYLTQNINQLPILYITTIGLLFLSVSIGYLVYIYNKKEKFNEK